MATNISIPLAGIALFVGVLFLVLAVLSLVGYLDHDRWQSYFFGGIGLFVAGYQGVFVVPVLHRRLNELEMRAGRQVDSHERRLQEIEKARSGDAT